MIITLAGDLNSSTEVAGALSIKGGLSGELESSVEMTGSLTVHPAPESSITIFVDILDSAIIAAQNSNIRRYQARLIVDGDPVPIRQASLEARKDSLGTELRVTLAIADRDQIDFDSSITFELGIWTTSWVWIPLLEGGKLSSIENPIRNNQNAPADEVLISIVDVIADRWNRAPRAPIHLYDSNLSAAPTETALAAQRIELQTGGYIVPVNTPIPDMMLQNVLHEAYVVGEGFDEVVTNIPNFPVTEIDFTLDGGFHAAVASLVNPFAPLTFERNNTLFIIDPDGPLPAGFTPRTFPQSLTRELTDATPQREPVNAIIVRLKAQPAWVFEVGDYFTEISNSQTTYAGDPGTPSYTVTTVEQFIRTFHNIASPGEVVREEVIGERTTVVDWEGNVLEVTDLTQTYDSMNRKTGHTRRVAKRMPDLSPGGGFSLVNDVSIQKQRISYRLNPLNPAEYLQDTVATVESGLVLVDPSHQYFGQPYKLPYTAAHQSRQVDRDAGQTLESGDIKTTIESLRVIGQQVHSETRIIDHIAGTTTQTSLTTRPGGTAINTRGQVLAGGGGGGRLMMIVTPGTDGLGRRAQVFDGGMLPAKIAIELGERKLRKLNSPPREISLQPAYVDVSIRRGTLLAIEGRGNELIGNYLVEGYSINFAPFQPDSGAPVSMSVQAREVSV